MLDADLERSFLAGASWKNQNNIECSNTTLNERRVSNSFMNCWLVKRTENEAIIVNLDLCLSALDDSPSSYWFQFRNFEFDINSWRELDICGQAIKGIWGMSWH
jgi:hypothetical protein